MLQLPAKQPAPAIPPTLPQPTPLARAALTGDAKLVPLTPAGQATPPPRSHPSPVVGAAPFEPPSGYEPMPSTTGRREYDARWEAEREVDAQHWGVQRLAKEAELAADAESCALKRAERAADAKELASFRLRP